MPELEAVDWRALEPIPLTPILEAALTSFSEGGYHGATVRSIAAAADVSVPLLYYHHKNKQGLIVDLFQTAYASLEQRVELARKDAAGDPLLDFCNIIESIVLHSSGHIPFAEINSELRYVALDERRPLIDVRDRIERQLVESIENGVAAGLFTVAEPGPTARALAGMCNAVAQWYRPSGPKSPQQLATDYVGYSLGVVGYRASDQSATNAAG